MATSSPTSSDFTVSTFNNLPPTEVIDAAITYITNATGSQYVDFLSKTICNDLHRRTFNRFIIGDGPWTFGLWRPDDDINLYFLTSDSENRWAEVLTEALGIEVGNPEMKEATKKGKCDLTDERLCHIRDGRRTQFWHLRHTSHAKARVVLHYCKISSEWLGSEDLLSILKDAEDGEFPSWLEDMKANVKSYTKNYSELRLLKSVANSMDERKREVIREVYPYARAWTEVTRLWRPELVDPTTLWSALSNPCVLGRVDEKSSAETTFLDTLKVFASDEIFPQLISDRCRQALRSAATESLRDSEKTLATVRDEMLSAGSVSNDGPRSTSLPSCASTTPFGLASKFRDARSALNRLRHDAAHAGIAYDVGYVDRFEGMKWMSLVRWGGKRTEEEDWIPEHRVRQIVRVEDGVIIWDREKRVDRTGDV